VISCLRKFFRDFHSSCKAMLQLGLYYEIAKDEPSKTKRACDDHPPNWKMKIVESLKVRPPSSDVRPETGWPHAGQGTELIAAPPPTNAITSSLDSRFGTIVQRLKTSDDDDYMTSSSIDAEPPLRALLGAWV